MLNRVVPDPFRASTSWHVADRLDLGALRLACDPLLGEHDFTSFCRPPRGAATYSMVRRVTEARWDDLGEGVVQAVVAEFLSAGHFTRHLRRMRRLYAERQAALLRTVKRETPGLMDVFASDAGMHLIGWLEKGISDDAVARHLCLRLGR